MKCDFSLNHYKKIIDIALENSYRFIGFTENPAAKGQQEYHIYLRHDIDLSPSCALEMAEIDASMGVSSTFLFQPNCPFYNLYEETTMETIHDIKGLGHWIGLHIDPPHQLSSNNELIKDYIDGLFSSFSRILPIDKVISFHVPTEMVLNEHFPGYESAYEPKYFSEIKYLSESNRHWREGCPCKALQEREFNIIQLLMHPFWWIAGDDYKGLGKQLVERRTDELRRYITNISSELDDLFEQ